MADIQIRPVQKSDYQEWMQVYRGYRDFYKKPHDPQVYERLWEWLCESSHGTTGLVAEVGGNIVGIAHYRFFARPIVAATGIYLDDLYVHETARGSGVATAVLAHLAQIAAASNATVVRWITAESNQTARRVYDRVAQLTPWMTYDLQPAELDTGR